jgi:hypothetical protein
MRFFRKPRADPFAAFTERHGTRPQDAPMDEPKPELPEPPLPGPTWARGTLGVSLYASQEEIRAAYKSLAREHHPDKVASLSPEVRGSSEERMKEINVAYAELKR